MATLLRPRRTRLPVCQSGDGPDVRHLARRRPRFGISHGRNSSGVISGAGSSGLALGPEQVAGDRHVRAVDEGVSCWRVTCWRREARWRSRWASTSCLCRLGVCLPLFALIANGYGLRHNDEARSGWPAAGRTSWASLFAVGAVTGTVLSFELGVLWPGLLGRFGDVFGVPFMIEGIAFFLEAIFIAIYIFGWDRLQPAHALVAGPAPAAVRVPGGVLDHRRQLLDEHAARLSPERDREADRRPSVRA